MPEKRRKKLNDLVIRTVNLTKKFGSKIAVNDLNLNVRRGEIYGFVGKNGAGKTTAMKLILNLLNPTEGDVYLFGEKTSPAALKRTGSLIEAPGLYADCSAYENLLRFSYLSDADVEDIPRLIRLAGLEEAKDKKVKAYSLGMKQRLGIAVALIGNPELVILDEPINGLDPQGIKEVRDLITSVNRSRGTTFFISSHILSELEKVATKCGILENGVLLDEIDTENITIKTAKNVEIVCDQIAVAERIINETFGLRTSVNNSKITAYGAESVTKEIIEALVAQNVGVRFVTPLAEDFESYFIGKTGGQNDVGTV